MKVAFLLLLIINSCLTFSQRVYMKVSLHDGTRQIFSIQEISKLTFDGVNVGIIEPGKFQNVVNAFTSLKSYPNPFSTNTTLAYELPEAGKVEITIVDLNGKRIRTLLNEKQDSGKHQINWDRENTSGKSMPPGIYSCIVKFLPDGIHATPQILTNKMILIN